MTQMIHCDQCDGEIECETVVSGLGQYPEIPDECPHCGTILIADYSNYEEGDCLEY